MIEVAITQIAILTLVSIVLGLVIGLAINKLLIGIHKLLCIDSCQEEWHDTGRRDEQARLCERLLYRIRSMALEKKFKLFW